jgi:aldehyde dehydrogenase (NAD+)
MTDVIHQYIEGRWTGTIDVDVPVTTLTNPASGDVSGSAEQGSPSDVDRAVAAARRAFRSFSRTSPSERADLLRAVAAEYTRRGEDMAVAVTTDMGIPLANSRVAVAAGAFQFSSLADVLADYQFERPEGGHVLRKEPIGVCGLIPPWNYPALQMAEKVAPALAAGCTVVLKPAEVASHAGQVFAEIMDAAGAPPGVFNMVLGRGSVIGTALSTHPDVDMIAFTGSTQVGVQVQRDAAETVKRVSLELGGKSAHIVLPDADLAAAVAVAVEGVMGNSGQTCAAPTRTLVPRSVKDQFTEQVRQAVEALTVGDPRGEVNLGPVASEAQWRTVQRYIETGIEERATLIAGGPGKPAETSKGWFVRPTVFADVTNDMRIAREEIFGPVMSLIWYDTVDEAVEIANDSPYGLVAYVQGTDHDLVHDVASRLRAGQVIVNSGYPDLTAPFGGYKQSGNGRIWGAAAALDEYLETKAIVGAL